MSFGFGVNTPTFSTMYSWLVDIILIFIFFLRIPSITLIRITTPKYESYQLSINKHFKISFSWPFGDGKALIICSKISSIPSPVFPEQETAFRVSIPITSSICFFVSSILEAGRSILFKIGIISWLVSKAW